MAHLDGHQLLGSRQHGFQKGKSTSTVIIKISRQLFDNFDKGQHTSCVFVDCKKVFETLDNAILLKKLGNYGFDKLVNTTYMVDSRENSYQFAILV